MVTLADLPIGAEGCVVRIEAPLADALRLAEMGLTVGARLRVVRQAPMGDPIEVSVRGCRLSIRRADAQAILLDSPEHA